MIPHQTRFPLITLLIAGTVSLLTGLLWLLNPAPPTYAQSQPQALGALSGVVRNEQGNPLPGVTVMLQPVAGQNVGRQTTTDAQGAYQFAAIFSSDYRLFFQPDRQSYAPAYYSGADFYEDAQRVTVNGNTVSGIDMVLRLGGAISVTVQEADPMTTTYFATTLYRQTATGRWTSYRASATVQVSNTLFAGLPSGSYRLCVEATYLFNFGASSKCYNNVLPESYGQLAANASDIQVMAGAETRVSITLNDIPQVEGVVRDENNQPAEGIYVALLQSYSAPLPSGDAHVDQWGGGYPLQIRESDDQGHFQFGYVAKGPYLLVFNYPYEMTNSYLSTLYPPQIAGANAPMNINIDSSTRLNLSHQLVPEARIVGRVSFADNVPLDYASIIPLEAGADGAWVQPQCLYFCPQPTYDSSTGTFTVTQLAAGRYRLRAERSFGWAQTPLVGYFGGNTLESAADIVLATGEIKPNIDIVMADHQFDSSLSGQVTAKGKALGGIEVGLFSPQFEINPISQSRMPFVSTTTDTQGHYKFEGLTTGAYLVGFRDSQGLYATTFYTGGISSLASSVVITQTGEISKINVVLSPGATIRGRIHAQIGQQPGGYVIQITSPLGGPYFLLPLPFIDEQSAADGTFVVSGLPPGTYLLSILLPPVSDAYSPTYRFYPGTDDPYSAKPIVLQEGQTLEGMDIFLFANPTVRLPIASRNASSLSAPSVGQ